MNYQNARDKIEEMMFLFKAMDLKTKLIFSDLNFSVQISTIPKEGSSVSLSETIYLGSTPAYMRLKTEFEG
jgi:hypothetical protein